MVSISLLFVAASLATTSRSQDFAGAGAPRTAKDSLLAVELTVSRIGGDSDIALVSSGVPLAPGSIKNPRSVRWDLYVDGSPLADTSFTVVPLAGSHRDGSLRAVLVQFRYSLRRADRVRASLWARSGQPAAAQADARRTDVLNTPAVPEAVALPTSVDYLIKSDFVGPTTPAGSSERMGGDWATYERQFRNFSDRHWATSAALWSAGNYYDRAAIYYAWWVRTANVEYWRRATLMAADYRIKYLEANNYGSSIYWAQLEGIALHYLATGDSKSRLAVGRTADVLGAYYRHGSLGNRHHHDMESRGQARSLLAFLLAWEVRAPGGRYFNEEDWSRHLPLMLTQILSAQDSSGAFLWDGYCGSSTNYMVGMLNDALVRYHARFAADSRILPSVKASSDWLLATQWRPDGSFNYQSVYCQREGAGPSPSPDLNLMYVSSLAWLYWMTGEPRYRDAADRVFRDGVRRASLSGTKQFNQNYTTSFHYLAYRTRS